MALTRNEVIRLLQIAVSYDNRQPAEATIWAWTDAADRGRWTYSAAAEAIKDHYANTTDFVMPGHITQRVRIARQDEALRELPSSDAVPADPRPWRTQWNETQQRLKRECAERRRIVLGNPEIAAKLSELPLRLKSPAQWKGYIPPKTLPDGDPNLSPIRQQLLTVMAEVGESDESEPAA